jgi:hypothetical protein
VPVPLLAWIVTCTLQVLGSADGSCAVPSNSLNAPRTFVTMACRAAKPILVCAASSVYVPTSWSATAAVMTSPL